MAKINLQELSIKKAHDLIQSGDFSAREFAEIYLNNIKKHDNPPAGGIHAYLEVFDDVYNQAEEVDKKVKRGETITPLAGIPVAIKDNMLIKGRKCSAGSKILENFTAVYDATVIKKLKQEGVVFLGRTNMDEFAMGSSTENSAFGPTKNPYDEERVSGGSSGGSAAAVARQECMVALGSDTGGSIRQPAAFCGVVGLKPTYGAVSRYGLIALASSLDQIGPFAKTVEDAEIVFNAIKGRDPMDSTTIEQSVPNLNSKPLNPKKIGIPKEFFDLSGENDGIDKAVADKFRGCVDFFQTQGFKIKQISLDSLRFSLPVYYIIMPAEASSNLARFDGVKYGFYKEGKDLLGDYMNTRGGGFGSEPSRRIVLGTHVLSAGYYDAYYGKAQNTRALITEDVRKIFESVEEGVDFIISPTAPNLPFKIGDKSGDPVQMYLADMFTVFANLSGNPAISLPCGFGKIGESKLPVGLQVVAPWFCEDRLFELGKIFENNFIF